LQATGRLSSEDRGPSAFLEEQKLEIARGDELEVIGSRVTIGSENVVLAREITRAGRPSSFAMRRGVHSGAWAGAEPPDLRTRGERHPRPEKE
jgi:hypothetical protein